MNKKGFTLIEVLIVVIILGILATLAIPQFTGMVAKARLSEAWSGLGAVRTAQAVYYMEHDNYADDIDDLDVDDVVGDFTLTVTSAAGNTGYVATATGAGDAADIIAEVNQAGDRDYDMDGNDPGVTE